jgi:hypothetical protein
LNFIDFHHIYIFITVALAAIATATIKWQGGEVKCQLYD